MFDRIYVQVPAYRDPELVATVDGLVRMAKNPDRLVIAVAWQYGVDEEHVATALERLPQVRLLRIRAADSLGCNWARNLLQQRWAGERYTLFLDSHHRFVAGWDETLIRLLERQRRGGHARPIITGYLPPYDPDDDPHGRTQAVYELNVAERREGIAYRLHGHPVEGWERLTAPQPARFVSLHFLFADGSFNQVVPCDPEIYFFADEVAISLRAFSHGYDLFRPHVVLGWHLYDRSRRVPHWADHPRWEWLQQRSIARLRALYSGALTGPYGLGGQRSVSDYESFTGIRLLQEPGLTEQEKHSWNSHLARAIASPPSTATRSTFNRISSSA
jgi:Glycosyltransferase (GlcNAc)